MLNEQEMLLEQSQTLVAIGSRITDFFKKLKKDLLIKIKQGSGDKEQTAEEIVMSEIIMMLDIVLKSIHAGFTKEDPNALSKMESVNRFMSQTEELLANYDGMDTTGLTSRKNKSQKRSFINEVLRILEPIKSIKDDTKLIEAEKSIIAVMKTFMSKVGYKQPEETDIDEENNAIRMLFPIFKINPVKDFKQLLYVSNQVRSKLKIDPKKEVTERDVQSLKTDQAKELEKQFGEEFEKKYNQEMQSTQDEDEQLRIKAYHNPNMIKHIHERWKEVFTNAWDEHMQAEWEQWHKEQIKKERETVGHLVENIPPEIQALRSQMKTIFEGIE